MKRALSSGRSFRSRKAGPKPNRLQEIFKWGLGLIFLALILSLQQIKLFGWRGLVILGVCLGSLFLLRFIFKRVAKERKQIKQRLRSAWATQQSPEDFEIFTKVLLEASGWKNVIRVGGGGDQGVDLRGVYRGQRCIVQCKRYKDQVPPSKVRELVGTLHIQKAKRAFLITTSRFTPQGYTEAQGHPIELWDSIKLTEKRREAEEARQKLLFLRLVLAFCILMNLLTVLIVLKLP